MKLIYRIIIRLSIIFSVVLALWAAFFYFAMIDEINDETDDALENYSEQIIIRFLTGEEISSVSSNSNSQYYLSEITLEYANSKPHISYADSMVYIPQKQETEPARVLSTIFKNENEKYYELVVLTPTIEKADLTEAILYWVIFLYIGLLVVILLVNVWVYYQSNRPLHKLLTWLEKYKVGGKNVPLHNDTDITEFRKLNEAAVQNMKRAEEVFEEQKQFIGNASHELQTPLAVCQNRMENLMEDETLTENQLEELAKTCQTLEYIAKLNKSLLLLSRIENKQFVERHDVDLNIIVKKLIQDYEEVYSYMNIRAEIKETDLFNVRINEVLVNILVNNLLKNSFVHNVKNGCVQIEISSSRIIFKNTGLDFSLNPTLIFERFYQGHKKEGSTGLGLSLVKSVCNAENLQIRYCFENNFHCFEIFI